MKPFRLQRPNREEITTPKNQVSLDLQGSPKSKKLEMRIIIGSTVVALTIGIGVFFSTVSLQSISPDFYNKITLREDVDLSKEVEYKDEKLKLSEPGMTGGGGDPQAVVTKKGVLGIVNGSVTGKTKESDIFGSGGHASGIDQILAGSGGLRKGGVTGGGGRGGVSGVGFGTGYGSGMGGNSGGELTGMVMGGGGGSSITLNKKCAPTQELPQTLATGEGYRDQFSSDFTRVSSEPLSTFSIDVDVASYANFRRFITQGSLPPKEAIRIEECINYFDYRYINPTGKHPFSITAELTESPWNGKHYLAHIGIQGKVIAEKKRVPSNLVFLIDVSGSMQDANKLPLVKQAFALLVQQMRPEDRIAIVVYAGSAGCVLTSTSGTNKQKILASLEKLESGGSTAGSEGIIQAYEIAKRSFLPRGNNRVVLATDGDFNVGVSSDDELVKLIETKRNQGIFLSVLGFGTGNYQDGKMEQLADKGNGNYAYIDNLLEAKKVLVKQMQGTLYTIAKDVKLQVEFNPSTVAGYRLIGYDNRRLAKEDFNNDAKDAGELGAGHTVTALYEIIPAGQPVPSAVDDLKYQKTVASDTHHGELFTVNLRYKQPKGSSSILLSKAVLSGIKKPFVTSSENHRFAASVAGSMMILKGYSGVNLTLDQTIASAKKAKGEDFDGYRAEFITLMEKTKLMLEAR